MQDPDTLRSRFAIPGVVEIELDPHGLTRLNITSPLADAQVYLHGAHVTHYQPRGQRPVLFLSSESTFAAGKPIRGGVPVIFPWFGPHPTDPTKPAHGWARTSPWTLQAVTREGDGVGITLALASDGFDLSYTVRVGAELHMELSVQNSGASPRTFEEALHTYLAVGHAGGVGIAGLSGRQYLDKVDQMKRKTEAGHGILLVGETDRVYLDTPDAICVRDPIVGRTIIVSKQGSASTVLWNPWAEKAKKLPDFGDDEWPLMLCVETANVADNAVTLAPGQRHVIRAEISAGRRAGL